MPRTNGPEQADGTARQQQRTQREQDHRDAEARPHGRGEPADAKAGEARRPAPGSHCTGRTAHAQAWRPKAGAAS